jgi:dienelactone hydrolase
VGHIVLFHSVYGSRGVERRAAALLREAGHQVRTPDLYAGATAATLGEGFAIKERIGWDVIEGRARAALADLPSDVVLAGFSMGAGVVGALLPSRPATRAVVLVHGVTAVPGGIPAQVHVADPDPFAPREQWPGGAEVFAYPGAGHFFTDEDLPEHDPVAASLVWRRVLGFLSGPV